MDAEAREIQNDHERLLNAAEDAGLKMSNDVRSALIAMYAEHGLVKMLDGLRSCVEHGAPNLAYLKACVNGSKKRAMPEQAYGQRSYSGEQDEALRRMMENKWTGEAG